MGRAWKLSPAEQSQAEAMTLRVHQSPALETASSPGEPSASVQIKCILHGITLSGPFSWAMILPQDLPLQDPSCPLVPSPKCMLVLHFQ